MHGMPIQAERGVMVVERKEREALKASLCRCGGRPLHALVLRDSVTCAVAGSISSHFTRGVCGGYVASTFYSD